MNTIYARIIRNDNEVQSPKDPLPAIEHFILGLVDGSAPLTELYHYLPALSYQRWQEAISALLHHDFIIEIMMPDSRKSLTSELPKYDQSYPQFSKSFAQISPPKYKNYPLEITAVKNESTITDTLQTEELNESMADITQVIVDLKENCTEIDKPTKQRKLDDEDIHCASIKVDLHEEISASEKIESSTNQQKRFLSDDSVSWSRPAIPKKIISKSKALLDSLIYRLLLWTLALTCFVLGLRLL